MEKKLERFRWILGVEKEEYRQEGRGDVGLASASGSGMRGRERHGEREGERQVDMVREVRWLAAG